MDREALLGNWKRLPHPVRWIGVAIVGGSLIISGIVMLVLPGPGIAFIILGLAVLATEFVWAEVLMHKVKKGSKKAWRLVRRKPPEEPF